MFKRAMLMTCVVVAATAFAVPAVSSAKWADGTVPLVSGTNPIIVFEGPTSFFGALGGLSCNQNTASAQITGGQSNAHVTSFSTDNPAGCSTQGALAFCTLTSRTFENGSWPAHTNTSDIQITNVKYQLHFSGGFCPTPTIQLHGDVTVQPAAGQLHGGQTGQVKGTLTGTVGAQNIGPVTVEGSGKSTPSGTYGLT